MIFSIDVLSYPEVGYCGYPHVLFLSWLKSIGKHFYERYIIELYLMDAIVLRPSNLYNCFAYGVLVALILFYLM